MPIAVTEYAPLTGADYSAEGSSSNDYYQAARLATQLMTWARLGQEAYYFKFSQMPSGSTSGNPSAATMVSKHGIHFGENFNTNSMQVGDQTTSGAVFALIAPYITGNKPVLNCGMSDTAANFVWPPTTTTNVVGVSCLLIRDSNVYRLFLAADCNGAPARQAAGVVNNTGFCADRQLTIPLSSLNVDPTSVVVISQVSAPANYCVNPLGVKDGISGGTRDCNDPVFALKGVTPQKFGSTSSSSGYFGEMSALVPLSPSIISAGLPYVLPAFGVTRIDIPISAQVSSVQQIMVDTTLMAGANSDVNHGQLYNLTASISETSVHDTTSAIMLQWSTPTFSPATVAYLQLTVLNPPNSGTVILQVVGINPTAPPMWNENLTTWATVQNLLKQPTGVVQSIGDNFVKLGPSNTNNVSLGTFNYVVGHISVSAQDKPGTNKLVDLTKFVQMAQAANACSLNIAIVRRFRSNLQAPADLVQGKLMSDTLATGAVMFYADEHPEQTGPRLFFYADAAAPVKKCVPAQQLNSTVTTTVYVSGVTSGNTTTFGRRKLLQSNTPMFDAVMAATQQSIAQSLGVPLNGVYVTPGNYTVTFPISFSQLTPSAPFTADQITAAFEYVLNGSATGAFYAMATEASDSVTTDIFINGTRTTPTQTDVSDEITQLAQEGRADPAGISDFLNNLPAGLQPARRKLQQVVAYSVTATFFDLLDAEAFISTFLSTGITEMGYYLNDLNTTVGNVTTASVAFQPTIAAGIVVDTYAPYHSPVTPDALYYGLQDSQSLNIALDVTPLSLPAPAGRRLFAGTTTNLAGDECDIIIDPNPPTILPGWQPQGSAAPAAAPELVIVIVPAEASSASSSSEDQYSENDLIGVGVGVGLGEALVFTIAVVITARLYSFKRRLPAGEAAGPAADNAATRSANLEEQVKASV